MQALPQFIIRQPLNELSFLPRRGIDDRQYGLAESKRKLPVFTTAIVSTGIHLSARPRADPRHVDPRHADPRQVGPGHGGSLDRFFLLSRDSMTAELAHNGSANYTGE